jgi:protein-disulfide isomerase
MLKRILFLPAMGALVLTGCTKQFDQINTRLDALEKRLNELEKKPETPPPPPPPAPKAAINLPIEESPVFGDANAKVAIVVFSDFQCPYCGIADKALRAAVMDKDLKGKVKLVFKNFPLSFHPAAKPAARASLAAREQGNDKYWKMSEKLFANQRDLNDNNYVKWAGQIGLNVKKFESDLKANVAKYDAAIQSDMTLGQNDAKVEGTPWIFIGGFEYDGDRSIEDIKSFLKGKNLL